MKEKQSILPTENFGGGGLLKNKKDPDKKKKKVLVLIGVLVALGIIIGVSYAWWSHIASQTSINQISSDCLKIEIEDALDESGKTTAIQLEKAYPLTDEEAKELKPYTFKVKNTCNLGVVYDVNLEVMDVENRLKSEYIAASFENRAKQMLNTYPSVTPSYKGKDYTGIEAYGLTSGELKAGESKNYSIKLWIDESVTVEDDAMNKMFIGKISVNASLNQVAEIYKEEILNGAEPVIKGDLIPVVIASDGTVTKANLETEWYNYGKKNWANAVILVDKTKNYNSYDVIPEENIESYFVWIPKYSYQLWDLGEYNSVTEIDESKVHEIPVRFGITDTSDSNEGECTTPMNAEKTQGLSGESGACQIGDYMTHPAFISMKTNGLWVGKFETGYKGAETRVEAEQNTNDASRVQIKPNVYSWRGIQVANAHLTSYNYERELDSHMMKNTEWGAVAYLQHSKCGSSQSVRINNNSDYKTGYAAVNEPTCGYTATNEECNKYGTGTDVTVGYFSTNTDASGEKLVNLASTTRNISGVFDMSGGTWEYMMGVIVDQNGKPVSGRHNIYNSGFNGTLSCSTCTDSGVPVDKTITSISGKTDFPVEKYYDKYAYGTSNRNYKFRILGDATGEMGPFANATYGSQTRQIGSWYKDEARFISNEGPWFSRGARFVSASGSGAFTFNYTNGFSNSILGFRVVLAV